jgi:hypothetical protein
MLPLIGFGAAVSLDFAVTALLQTLPQEQRLILRSLSNIVPSDATAHVWAAELASRLHPSGCTVAQVTPASCAWSVLTGGEKLAAHHPEVAQDAFPGRRPRMLILMMMMASRMIDGSTITQIRVSMSSLGRDILKQGPGEATCQH